MSLKRIAEELDVIAQDQEDKELEETLAACGLLADDDEGGDDGLDVDVLDDLDDGGGDEELNDMIASVLGDYDVSGVNSEDQDEFTQVQDAAGSAGREDYPSVADAAKKLASIARHLESVKRYAASKGQTKRYAKYFKALESGIEKRASVIRKAAVDKTPFPGTLGKDGDGDAKAYGAYDKSGGEEAFAKRDLGKHDWKNDGHDDAGFGIPKMASIRVAANKAVQLAVCLLGNKAPEDMVESQGRDFFASMNTAALDRALKRFADTAELYERKDGEDGGEITGGKSEDEKDEMLAGVDFLNPEDENAEGAVASGDGETFTDEEEKEIQAMVASIKARKARLAAEAERRITEDGKDEKEASEDGEDGEDSVETASDDEIKDEIVLADDGTEGLDDEVEPELAGIFEDEEQGEDKVASKKAKAKKASKKFAQKIPSSKIASATAEIDELSQIWADDGDGAFA